MQLEFNLVPSVTPFVTAEDFIALIVGPVGSAKTTAGIAKIAYHAARMAPCKDGIRRSRAVWVRNTREQLRDTSIPDFTKWYQEPDFGIYERTNMKFILRFGDTECEVLFRALEDAADVRKLLSLQASFAIFEEFREINSDVFEAMQGRLGRYPDGMMVPHRPEWGMDEKGNPIQGCVTDDGQPNKHVWGMSNAPDLDTYWEAVLTDPPENTHVTIQPSGLSPDADWIHFLPSNYYEDLAIGKAEDYIDVYIHSKFGKSLSGQPVHRSFNRDIHVAKSPLQPNRLSPNPLLIGMDIALNPAVVIGQMDFNGRLVVLDCLHAQGMGVLRFCREKLRPLLANKYAGMQSLIIVDPSGVRRMDTDESTVVSLLRAEKFAVKMAMTNRLAPRLAAVDNYLTRMVDGKSAILIDPGADMLIKALAGKYRYRIKKSGEEEDEPDKTHPWSDIADALQYLCLHADGGQIYGNGQHSTARQEVKPAPFKWAV